MLPPSGHLGNNTPLKIDILNYQYCQNCSGWGVIWQRLEKLKMYIPYISEISLLHKHPRDIRPFLYQKTRIGVLPIALFVTVRNWKQARRSLAAKCKP